MTADPFTRASAHYRHARRLGATPLPRAYGEVAETGRLPFLTWQDLASLGAVGLFVAFICMCAVCAGGAS